MSNSKLKKKTNSDQSGHEADGLNAIQTGKGIENTQWTKWRTKNGHGFSAEDANAQADRLRFAKVDPVGRSNEKDGADRIVRFRQGNTTSIQTKYYQTAKDTINAAFDKQTGLYRYKGQVIEVPKDQYVDAIPEMADKIRAGKVPGVSDPQKAESLLKQGDATYAQAKNIAKAGNIDSLKFDIIEQSVMSSCALGISFVISFASCKWNGMDTKQALRLSSINAVKSGAIVMGSGIITRQFLRTPVGRNFAAFSTKSARAIVNQVYKTDIGKKAIHKLASAIAGKALTGAAAKNVVTRLARSTWPITICITTATAMPDLYRAAITKEISWSQFTKNLSVNVSGALGGIGGAAAGAILGSMIFPGAGTAIGAIFGLAGGLGGGIGSSKLASWIADMICDDDSDEMNCIIQKVVPQLSSDFLVSEEEFAQILKEMQALIDVKWIRKMYQAGAKGKSSKDATMFRAEYAYSELSPIFEKTIAKRTQVTIPADKEIKKDLRTINVRLFIEFLKYKIAGFFGKNQTAIDAV